MIYLAIETLVFLFRAYVTPGPRNKQDKMQTALDTFRDYFHWRKDGKTRYPLHIRLGNSSDYFLVKKYDERGSVFVMRLEGSVLILSDIKGKNIFYRLPVVRIQQLSFAEKPSDSLIHIIYRDNADKASNMLFVVVRNEEGFDGENLYREIVTAINTENSRKIVTQA
jgi:hypothetical protein